MDQALPAAAPAEHAAPPIAFGDAFLFWLKLGFISFGGPAGQIAIMHRELVERRRWISEGRFLHALNYCMVLPGPEATQLAIYIGWLMHGTLGGGVAGVCFVLPGALLLTLLSYIYVVYHDVTFIASVLFGFKAAVIVLVLGALQRIGKRAIRSVAFALIAAMALALMICEIPFPAILLTAALIGWIGPKLSKNLFPPAKKTAHGAQAADAASGGPAFIGDDSPTPPHARIDTRRLAIMSAIFAVLLAGPLVLLELALGHDHIFSQMGRFFTIASFSTIGGAYAVLPYVTQMSTRVYGWLKPGEMMSGLALGETTPGPLILVLTFVGFVGAWNWNALYHTQGLAAPLTGAAIATYFTFLPSFLFILIGGPFVERTRNEIAIDAVLSCITAAVVGAIVNMEIFFTVQFLFPAPENSNVAQPHFLLPPPDHHFDLKALLLVALAAVALFWRKWEPMAIVGACGAFGVLDYTFRALHWIS